jgi:hypothetical protein
MLSTRILVPLESLPARLDSPVQPIVETLKHTQDVLQRSVHHEGHQSVGHLHIVRKPSSLEYVDRQLPLSSYLSWTHSLLICQSFVCVVARGTRGRLTCLDFSGRPLCL